MEQFTMEKVKSFELFGEESYDSDETKKGSPPVYLWTSEDCFIVTGSEYEDNNIFVDEVQIYCYTGCI